MSTRPPFRSGVRIIRKPSIAALVVSGALSASSGTAISAPVSLERTRPSDASTTISDLINTASRRFAVPSSWIAEIMQVESRGRIGAVSPKGAIGLMQVMPGSYAALAARYGLGADPTNPRDNVMAGAAYLRELHDRYGPTGMLAAYNAGPGRWEDHLSRARPLPDETVRYLARLGPVVGGSVGSLPAGDDRRVDPKPTGTSIFALLNGAAFANRSVGEKERVARTIVANTTVIGRPAALFVRRPDQTDAPSGVSQGGARTANGSLPARQPSRARTTFAPSSALLFAPRTGAGDSP